MQRRQLTSARCAHWRGLRRSARRSARRRCKRRACRRRGRWCCCQACRTRARAHRLRSSCGCARSRRSGAFARPADLKTIGSVQNRKTEATATSLQIEIAQILLHSAKFAFFNLIRFCGQGRPWREKTGGGVRFGAARAASDQQHKSKCNNTETLAKIIKLT